MIILVTYFSSYFMEIIKIAREVNFKRKVYKILDRSDRKFDNLIAVSNKSNQLILLSPLYSKISSFTQPIWRFYK